MLEWMCKYYRWRVTRYFGETALILNQSDESTVAFRVYRGTSQIDHYLCEEGVSIHFTHIAYSWRYIWRNRRQFTNYRRIL